MSQTTAANVLDQHSGFLISDSIQQYASGFLTASENQQAREMVEESLIVPQCKLNGWLLQARSNVTHYDRAIKNALGNGEPENSPDIDIWTSRLFEAIRQVEVLSALVGQSNVAA